MDRLEIAKNKQYILNQLETGKLYKRVDLQRLVMIDLYRETGAYSADQVSRDVDLLLKHRLLITIPRTGGDSAKIMKGVLPFKLV